MYLTLILSLLSVLERASEVLPQIVAAAKQNAELTSEQEREIDTRMAAAFASAAWKPDDQLAADRMSAEGGA